MWRTHSCVPRLNSSRGLDLVHTERVLRREASRRGTHECVRHNPEPRMNERAGIAPPKDRRLPALDLLQREIIDCRRCPRLNEHCSEMARVKRRAYLDWEY